MYYNFDGYTEEEFEKIYGYIPYCFFEGHKIYNDDIILWPNNKISLNFNKIRQQQYAIDGAIDGENPFESEDERFMRKQREDQLRRERMRENLRKNGLIK